MTTRTTQTIPTVEQFSTLLVDHAEQIIARWLQQTNTVWDASITRIPTVHARQLYEVLVLSRDLPVDEALAQIEAVPLAWQAIGLGATLQLGFQLRPAISATITTHLNGQGSEFHPMIDQFVDRCTTVLGQVQAHYVQAELHEQVAQAEYLISHQAQMASESDSFALQMATLYDLSQVLNSSLERSVMLQQIGPRVLESFNVEHCAIILRIDDEYWTFEQGWGESWTDLTGMLVNVNDLPSVMLEACEQGTLRLVPTAPETVGRWLDTTQGVLFVPLRQQDEILGCLVVQSPSLIERIDDVGMNLWRTFAAQVVSTLENTRLYLQVQNLNADLERKVVERTAELREERDRLEAIADIARDISTLEIDVLLNRILQALANLTQVQHGSVMLLDTSTNLLVDRAVLSDAEHEVGSRRFQVGEGVVGWIAQHRQPALVNDVQNDDRWVHVDAFGQQVGKTSGSLVGMPLIAGDEVVGVLMLSHPKTNFFNQSHMRLLKAIAGEIAIAIYNAQLYEYLAERTSKLSSMLRNQEEQTSQNNAILQSLKDAVIVFGTDRQILSANAAAETILDREFDQLITMSFDSLLQDLNIKLDFDPLAVVFNNSVSSQNATQGLVIQLGAKSISVSLVPVVTDRGELLGACLIARDITREVESDRLKTEFIGTVSHELRTPMTSIKGYTQLLAMGSLGEVNPTQKEFLTTIQQNAERMIAIINDLLDITKIETGSVELQPARLHVAEVLSVVISNAQSDLMQRNQEFTLNLAPNLPLIWADQERLRQVVNNVLSNAIKYTPRDGKISIHATQMSFDQIPVQQRSGLSTHRRYVAIAVQDSGVGIHPNEHEAVFERFYRTENPLKIEAGGTGLGLSLVRPLIELMGGRIWVDSQLSAGSTFTFIVPVPHDI